MSYCRKEGKDKIIFISQEDHEKASSITLPEDPEQPGILLPDGKINWNCPCLGGMATGPCGVEFRDAFSCFQYSTATPKGSDCFGQFHTMQNCMTQYPNLYPQPDPIPDDIQDELDKEAIRAAVGEDIDVDRNSSSDSVTAAHKRETQFPAAGTPGAEHEGNTAK